MEESYRAHQMRLEHSLDVRNLRTARSARDPSCCCACSKGRTGPYVEWLSNLDRQIKLKLGNDRQAGEEEEVIPREVFEETLLPVLRADSAAARRPHGERHHDQRPRAGLRGAKGNGCTCTDCSLPEQAEALRGRAPQLRAVRGQARGREPADPRGPAAGRLAHRGDLASRFTGWSRTSRFVASRKRH